MKQLILSVVKPGSDTTISKTPSEEGFAVSLMSLSVSKVKDNYKAVSGLPVGYIFSWRAFAFLYKPRNPTNTNGMLDTTFQKF